MDAFWLIVLVWVAVVFFGRSQQKARGGGRAGGPPRQTPLDDLRLMMEGKEPPMEDARRLAERPGVQVPMGLARPPEAATRAEPEVADYDTEATQLADQRRLAAATPAFLPPDEAAAAAAAPRTPPVPRITTRIESRIVDRVVVPPVAGTAAAASGVAGPGAGRAGGPSAATTSPLTAGAAQLNPAAARLAALASGGLRGAFVLSEILGPPRSEV